jgi:hypothetical protein
MAMAIPVSFQFTDFRARLIAARPRRILLLLLGLWLTNMVDTRLTLMAHQQGLLHELNPVASRLLDVSPAGVYVYKLLLVVAGSCLLWWCRRHRVAEMAAWFTTLAYVGVCVHWQTCYDAFLSEEFSEALAALAVTGV